jgi:F0F1-type ATP synthase assembly protein I
LKEEDNKEKKIVEKHDVDHSGLRWMSAGIEFCGVILVFCYFGHLLDENQQSSPLYLVTGFFISFIGMVYLFYKESKR